MKNFTVDQAIETQKYQLNEWKEVLKPSMHSVLVEYAQSSNDYARVSKNINDVVRGERLACFIRNIAIKKFANKN
jgi:hypothetical protein